MVVPGAISGIVFKDEVVADDDAEREVAAVWDVEDSVSIIKRGVAVGGGPEVVEA